MGTFKTKKTIYGSPVQIPYVAEQLSLAFAAEGYETGIKDTADGKEVNITKGGLFKAALGLRSALNIKMRPTRDGYIDFEAGSVSSSSSSCLHWSQYGCFLRLSLLRYGV